MERLDPGLVWTARYPPLSCAPLLLLQTKHIRTGRHGLSPRSRRGPPTTERSLYGLQRQRKQARLARGYLIAGRWTGGEGGVAQDQHRYDESTSRVP